MDDKIKTSIVKQLQKAAVKVSPGITFRSMYGGIVMELKKDDPKSRIGGIFSYSEYVSLELTNGALLQDPNGVLEGTGKLRRHVKIHKLKELEQKGCSELLRQAASADKS